MLTADKIAHVVNSVPAPETIPEDLKARTLWRFQWALERAAYGTSTVTPETRRCYRMREREAQSVSGPNGRTFAPNREEPFWIRYMIVPASTTPTELAEIKAECFNLPQHSHREGGTFASRVQVTKGESHITLRQSGGLDV